MFDDLNKYVPGYLQGLVKISLSYPFDTIKVQMQKGLHPTTISTLHNILKTDPYKLYRGSMLPYMIIPVERAIYYRYAEKLNTKYNGFASGLIMGAVSSIYYVPMQYATTNAVLLSQTNYKTNYKNIFGLVYKTNIKDLYKGFTVELVRSSLATSIFLGTYMHIRDTVQPSPMLLAPLLGPFSSTVSWAIVFPLDTIRTEKQTTNQSFMTIVNNKLKTYGIRSFYRGLTPIIIRTIPSTSLGMYLYEYSRSFV